MKLAPDLVPAAALAGRSCRSGATCAGPRRWSRRPGAPAASRPRRRLLNLRPGDSGARPAWRAPRPSQKLSSQAPEGRLAVARTALEAREFARARAALEPLLRERPTMRVCLLMSDLEQAEHGATGHGPRMARPRGPRAARSGLDRRRRRVRPLGAGLAGDRRLDAFVWQAPPDVLVAPELALHDDVTADLDDKPRSSRRAAPEVPPAPSARRPAEPRRRRAECRQPRRQSPRAADRLPAAPEGRAEGRTASRPHARAGGPAARRPGAAPDVFPVEHGPTIRAGGPATGLVRSPP